MVSEIRQQREDSFPVAVYDVGRKENKGWAQVLADATGNPASGAQSRLRTFKKKVAKVRKLQARVSQHRPK